jgi:single-strand DNA-binding protein
MVSLNKVLLIGNLTKQPELRYTPSGKAVLDIRLAVSNRYKTPDGQVHDEPCFLDIVVWDKQAEFLNSRLGKGATIFVEGRLQYDEWEKEGKKQSKIRVVAQRVQFIDKLQNAEFKDVPEGSSETTVEAPAEEIADSNNPPF